MLDIFLMHYENERDAFTLMSSELLLRSRSISSYPLRDITMKADMYTSYSTNDRKDANLYIQTHTQIVMQLE